MMSENENPSNADALDELNNPTMAALAKEANIKFLWSKPIPMVTFHNPGYGEDTHISVVFDPSPDCILSLYFYSNTAVNI